MSRYVREFTQKEKEEPKGKEEGASIDKRGLVTRVLLFVLKFIPLGVMAVESELLVCFVLIMFY